MRTKDFGRLSPDFPRQYFSKKNKYRNVRVTVDGKKFDSKAEAARYEEIKLLKQSGQVRWFIRQVRFDLTSSIYRADFLVVWADGHISVEDVKGFLTPVSKLKIKEVLALYGITVELIKCRGR